MAKKASPEPVRRGANDLLVVTGGPCSGKTTLVEVLGERGFATVPEAAIDVIAELMVEHGVEGQKRWRQEHQAEFQILIMRRQVENETRCVTRDAGTVFLDRGRLDGIAYCRHHGLGVPDEVTRLAARTRYDHVLLLDTLTDFEDRPATGRVSDRAASLAIRERIDEVYRERGLAPMRVPELPVEERVAFVLEAVGLG